ncbi:MAG: valine--tRNA ligase [Candidatus Magasanikbacteria bacterium]|nr:valine--tRNA ligase [Candidatus Magasanikbacteria bacterium]
MKELPKAYEPQKYEDNIYKRWEESGFFNPDNCKKAGFIDESKGSFSMVLPPPNVTGTLHIGHASMLAIEDLVTRYKRMSGFETLWLPGTDHAAIATQTKVEKLLIEKGIKDPKNELGREKFLAEVEKFAQESHDTIVDQCKKMGSSMDWSREAYTLDDARNLAVRTVFKKMYDDGLIYRGYRLVNWCPRCKSTLADDEVEHKEQIAKLYTFKYSADFPIAIATTRPETKLGDTALAVNPADERYAKYIGQEFLVKNFGGGADLKIKIIGEESIDMNFGTGALGVTPAHSATDYEMAQRNKLEIIKIIDEDGLMTKEAGEKYLGTAVKAARAQVVEWLKENNLLEKEEEIPNNLSICYRCGYAIEPLPSRQWFVDVNKEFVLANSAIEGIKSGDKVTLKKLMQQVVTNKQIEIIPDRFEKTYFHWINNLRDWCISRQIWYGHRIPVWYKNEEIFVGVEAPATEGWTQDSDTLDTWFSSGLWTFSTLGWPNNTADLKTFHPTSLLETGYDILFFWVARMILMTTYTLGQIPFEKVYLHGLVRDEKGRKMSKSLGNVINPLDTIAEFGADATRLSLLLGNTPGNDLKLSQEKVEGFRNFTNKLWNISRFMLLNIPEPKLDVKLPEAKTLFDEWILQQLNDTLNQVNANLDGYHFSAAGELLRVFTWDLLADWYLEIAKIEGDKSEILNYILNTLLKLWHPFMPFVTEQIWSEIYGTDKILMVEKWPQLHREPFLEEQIFADTKLIRDIIAGIRMLRSENKIEPVKKLNALIGAGTKLELLQSNSEIIKALARLENLEISSQATKSTTAVGFVEGGIEVFIDLAGVVDMEKEKERLKKELESITKYIAGIEGKLNNAEFAQNAPASVIEKEKEKLAEAQEKMVKLKKQIQ